MGTLDRSDAQLIAEAVTASLKAGGFISNSIANQNANTGTSSFNSGTFSSNVNMLSNGVSTLVNTTGQMVTGTATLQSMLGTMTGVIKIFGPIGEAVGRFGDDVGKYVLQISAQNQASAEYGANFNQNLGEYTVAIANAGMSQDQYNKLLAAAGQGVQGLGASAQSGADVFMKVAGQLFDSQAVLSARLAGLPLENFQSSLLTTSKLMAGQNMNTLEAQKTLQDSAYGAAIEIDNMSRITGRSRQEIQKNIDTQTESIDVAYMKLAMDKDQLAAYEDSITVVESLGPTTLKTFTEMAANQGQVVSKEGGKVVGAMQAIDQRLPGILQQLSVAASPEERNKLKTELMNVMGQAASDPQRFAKLTALGGGTDEVSRMISQLVKEQSGILLKTRQLGFEGEKVGKGAGAVYEDAIAAFKADREKAGTAAAAPGAATQQMILFAEDVLKRGNATLALEVAKGNTAAGQQITKMTELNTYIKPYTEEMRRDMIPAFKEYFRGKLPAAYTGVDTSEPRPGEPRKTREVGSIGSTDMPKVDKWFENFGSGTIMQLDGIETVLRKQDIPAFIQDNIKQFPGLIKGMEGGIKEAANSAQSGIPTVEQFEKLFAQIKPNNLPSITPSTGGSTIAGGEQKTISDLVSSLDKLNSKMDKLITTVEDGANKNVRAVKSAGNLAA